ncbi:unnamed protein product [Brassica oleracea var. botrytis]|uniref:Uncharacterized protein n=1 Tax=Brassica oleracea TaxID=3712 RepID=A0A3P6F9I4_BRAOL|nr:unnamed protein product [Brassica oleracea]
MSNKMVYGVGDRVDFVVGDFIQLAPSILSFLYANKYILTGRFVIVLGRFFVSSATMGRTNV